MPPVTPAGSPEKEKAARIMRAATAEPPPGAKAATAPPTPPWLPEKCIRPQPSSCAVRDLNLHLIASHDAPPRKPCRPHRRSTEGATATGAGSSDDSLRDGGRSASNELWRIIVEGFKPYNPDKLTRREAVDSQLNNTALHMIQTSVGTQELSRVRNFTTAKEAWDGLAASCIGSDSMRRNKYQYLRNQAEGFMRLPDEDHEAMYGRLLTVADAFRNVGATHINDSWTKEKYIECMMPFEPIDVKTLVGRECYSSLTSQQAVHEMQALKVQQNSRDSRNRAIGMSKGNNLALTVNSVEEVHPQDQYRASWSMSYPEDLKCHYHDHMAFHAKSFWVDPSKAKEDNIKRNNKSGFTSFGPKTRSCYNCDDKRHFIAECPYENRENHNGRLIPKDKSKDSKGKYSKTPNKKFYNNKTKKGKRPSRVVLVTREEYSSDEVESSSDDEEESSKEVAAIVTTNIPSSSLFESPNENPHIKNAHCFMARSTLDTSIVLSTQEEYTSGDDEVDDEEDATSNGLVALASLSTNSSSLSECPNEAIHVEEESCLMAKSSEDYAAGGSKWVLDSGCTSHMTGGKNLVKELRPNINNITVVSFGDNSTSEVLGFGKVVVAHNITLVDVMLVKTLGYNLISVSALGKMGFAVFIDNDIVVLLWSKTLKVAFVGGSRGRRRPRRDRSSDEFAPNAPRKSTTSRQKNKAPRQNYKSMDIVTYAAIRMKNWYEDLPRDDEIEGRRFWCMEQEFIYKDIYEPMRKVRPMQAINVDLLAVNNHFEDAIWVTGRMGLQDLMKIQCDYSPELIKQFYATLAFRKDDERTMEWMSGSTHCVANLRRFASILGLPEEGGLRLHGPQKTDKNVLYNLYDSSGAVGSTKGLLPIYGQVLRFLRATIAPSGGNNDALRGALVDLMHLSYKCARDGNEDEDFSLDVMDFIFNEIHDCMVSRTTMPYAPYIQLLINNTVTMGEDLSRFPKEKHSVKKAYKKKPVPHAAPSHDSFMGDARSSGFAPARHADLPAMKKQVKKLSWFQRHILCMNIEIHKENYAASRERSEIQHTQRSFFISSVVSKDLRLSLQFTQVTWVAFFSFCGMILRTAFEGQLHSQLSG
ncbi:hypothetical protein QYE76_055004 [Lolium multiflorum]|uniref:Retrovirus-related Pol polyprotein from transposon TNT 1-94-like beta-barrel domain-containing protein n=1 Tax=Lolium multiflorum TaxID=4521 RepID=A0AAD8SZT7_LOLMU|nr:hypothetical protein QYE76_055004 [Lolium multiflorum]